MGFGQNDLKILRGSDIDMVFEVSPEGWGKFFTFSLVAYVFPLCSI
jgi:hypothetical protein